MKKDNIFVLLGCLIISIGIVVSGVIIGVTISNRLPFISGGSGGSAYATIQEPSDYLSAWQAAEYFGVDYYTIDEFVRSGKLGGTYILVGGQEVFSKERLTLFFESLFEAGQQPPGKEDFLLSVKAEAVFEGVNYEDNRIVLDAGVSVLVVSASVKNLSGNAVTIKHGADFPIAILYHESEDGKKPAASGEIEKILKPGREIEKTFEFSPEKPGKYILEVYADFYLDDTLFELRPDKTYEIEVVTREY